MAHAAGRVCVCGSSNVDLVTYTDAIPKVGQTVRGTDFKLGFGGKGANQAVQCGRLGGKVTMITKLGRDLYGENTVKNYADNGIDSKSIFFSETAPSGVASITVDSSSHNSIIIVPGANDELSTSEVDQCRAAVVGARILVCQLEIQLDTTMHALAMARDADADNLEGRVLTMLNPAPAMALPDNIYPLVDIILPNETETEVITGMPCQTIPEAEAAGRWLLSRGVKHVVITLGERGALLITNSRQRVPSHTVNSLTGEVVPLSSSAPDDQTTDGTFAYHIPPQRVTAIDTTGAGDSFIGSLAYFMASTERWNDDSLLECCHKASAVAAVSVTRRGTQTSYATREELPKALFVQGSTDGDRSKKRPRDE